jgi:ubiquinone/menaquinone biosynthesis C-methylase UbiE
MINKSFENSEYWSDAWVSHIENYLSAPPRCGIWLNFYFADKSLMFLECAGGSCRDSRYLHDKGFKSMGTDFDENTLSYVRKRYGNSKFLLQKEDGFNLSFNENSFDVVFNNGFWVCFNDDEKIVNLLEEQVRVSSKYLVVMAHNKKNEKLVAQFSNLGEKDSLYKIRFFDIEDIEHILIKSKNKFRNIKYEKFGGPVDLLFVLEKRIPFLGPIVRWVVPRLYRFQPWSKVERIAVVIESEK